MQGKERTRPTDDLFYIFFNIRATRDPKTRRSWQRRARIALSKRLDLSPAERHEVCAVWSKSDCHLIDSPALSKCLGRAHIRFDGTRPASTVLRKHFDTDNKKPALGGFDGVAANDDFFGSSGSFQHTRQRLHGLHIRALTAVRLHSCRARLRASRAQPVPCARGDNESQPAPNGDTRLYPSRRLSQKQVKTPPNTARKRKKLIFLKLSY